VWMKLGKKRGSRMKKMGVLLPTSGQCHKTFSLH
jgi:hypothetical protein